MVVDPEMAKLGCHYLELDFLRFCAEMNETAAAGVVAAAAVAVVGANIAAEMDSFVRAQNSRQNNLGPLETDAVFGACGLAGLHSAWIFFRRLLQSTVVATH